MVGLMEKQIDTRTKKIFTINIVLFLTCLIAFIVIALLLPDTAFASSAEGAKPVPGTSSGSSGEFSISNIMGTLSFLVSFIFLPLGILIAGSKIIYIAIFCGVFGTDPLGWADPHAIEAPWSAVKDNLKGFLYGLFWVAGIWVVFQVILNVVALLANSLDVLF